MPDLFSKISEIMSNPEAAQKIKEIASSLASESSSAPLPPPAEESVAASSEPVSALNLFSGISAHSREVALLNAVRPYLRSSRAERLNGAIKAIRVIAMLSGLR